MKTIHRYTLAPTLEIPTGAVLLDAQAGQTGVSLWFLVDPGAEPETRRFALVPTGADLPDQILDCPHLATMKAIRVTDHGPQPVGLHLFEVPVGTELPANLNPPAPKTDPADWWKQQD